MGSGSAGDLDSAAMGWDWDTADSGMAAMVSGSAVWVTADSGYGGYGMGYGGLGYGFGGYYGGYAPVAYYSPFLSYGYGYGLLDAGDALEVAGDGSLGAVGGEGPLMPGKAQLGMLVLVLCLPGRGCPGTTGRTVSG